jgi:hypothetical protein
MEHAMITRTRRAALFVALSALVSAGGAAGDEETSIDRLNQQLKRIGNFTANAKVKLQNGVVGRTSTAEPGELPATPAMLCCSTNVQRIGESIVTLYKLVEELDACYAANATEASSAMTGVFFADLKTMASMLQGFADAETPRRAEGMIGAMSRTHHRMKVNARAVEDCPATSLQPPPPTDRSGEKGVDEQEKTERKKSH